MYRRNEAGGRKYELGGLNAVLYLTLPAGSAGRQAQRTQAEVECQQLDGLNAVLVIDWS